MSISTMYHDFTHDLRKNTAKIEVHVFNGWTYTFIETCQDVRVAISDHRGRFQSYERLPGPRNPLLSPNT